MTRPACRRRSRSGAAADQVETQASAAACFHITGSLDDFSGLRDHERKYLKAYRPRGLEIDDKIECGRLLDRKVAGICPLQDLVDIAGNAAKKGPCSPRHNTSVRHRAHAAGPGKLWECDADT